jgi:hypothetical protein
MGYLRTQADRYAALALQNIDREFPSYVMYVVNGPEDIRPRRPRDLHPLFYGSFDWHSCVEMYWVLTRLLRLVPDGVDRTEIARTLDAHITDAAVAGEVRFFQDPGHATVERPYGWGWLLRLHDELWALDTAEARRWATRLAPLTTMLADRLADWAEHLPYPNRSGLHANSAFGLSLALPYSQACARRGDPRLASSIEKAATRWYRQDRDYPLQFEPSAGDFLSPALVEAELMSRLLPQDAFLPWLDGFLGHPVTSAGRIYWQPIAVDRNPDGQTSHLLGLNLSRAWSLNRLAEHLPAGDERRELFRGSADVHAKHSLDRLDDGYMTSHWLVAYALLYLTE